MKSVIFLFISILMFGIISCASSKKLLIGIQSNQMLEKEITKTIRLQYLLFLPADYENKSEKWPMILFLHGAGERGDNLSQVKVHGPPKLINNGENFPFIIVSPQCPEDKWWDTDVLNELLKDVMKSYRVDKNRIYLTGLSMGGYGTWDMAQKYPSRFAAIAPICGSGNPELVERIKHLPIWVFHGAKDKVVPVKKSQDMVDALKKVGGNVKFAIYPEAGHDSWTETYSNPALYDWFLKHNR